MSGSLSYLLSLTMVAVIAYLTAEALRSKPIYESLLERIIPKQHEVSDTGKTLLIEFTVGQNARIAGRKIKEIRLPSGCLITSISRIGNELLPNGDTSIEGGDILTVLCHEGQEPEIYRKMEFLTDRKIKE